MLAKPISNLQKWFNGQTDVNLSFEDQWKLTLVQIGDHAHDMIDEDGRSLRNDNFEGAYFYDVEKLCDGEINLSNSELRAVVKHLLDNGWVVKKRSYKKVALTFEGAEKAQSVIDEVFNDPPADQRSWSYGIDESLYDWLLVHGHRAFNMDEPFCEDGMINFRQIADQHARAITDDELTSVLNDLEFKDMIACDAGPREGAHWANYNHGGTVAAELLEEIWQLRSKLPAADRFVRSSGTDRSVRLPAAGRFVRLDDNSQEFVQAVSSLEKLIEEANAIRVNDWPEKEGMITALTAATEMIKTRYVNKTAVLAAVSSVATFIMIKFAEAPIAELASATWTLIKRLFF